MKTLKTITLSLFALLIVTGITYATSTLIPQGIPGENTQVTLNDIYNKLVNINATPALKSAPDFDNPLASFRTLSEIYTLLETNQSVVISENIREGVEMFGVEGTLSTEPAELEWSTEQGSMNWDTAVSTCANLTEEENIDWRLPTISELLAGISDDWIIDGDGSGSRFAYYTLYWSGTEYGGISAWGAGWFEYANGYDDAKANEHQVRCVR